MPAKPGGSALAGRPPCPVCTSRYVAHVQDVLGNRSKRLFPQWVCLDCRSFYNPSGYREDDGQLQADYDYLVTTRDADYPNQNRLCLELVTRCQHVRSVCEVGYGLGWFLRSCNDYGRMSFGFEVNPRCHGYAREHLHLDCALGMLDAGHTGRYDLVAAIMVFEHLERPRELFALMRGLLNPDGAIYLCVPFVERRDWPFLWTAGTRPARLPPDPFFDNDVHVTHFSVDGMTRMGLSLGARTAEFFVSPDVVHNSPGAYQGILFRF